MVQDSLRPPTRRLPPPRHTAGAVRPRARTPPPARWLLAVPPAHALSGAAEAHGLGNRLQPVRGSALPCGAAGERHSAAGPAGPWAQTNRGGKALHLALAVCVGWLCAATRRSWLQSSPLRTALCRYCKQAWCRPATINRPLPSMWQTGCGALPPPAVLTACLPRAAASKRFRGWGRCVSGGPLVCMRGCLEHALRCSGAGSGLRA